jgi:hypothetical protein
MAETGASVDVHEPILMGYARPQLIVSVTAGTRHVVACCLTCAMLMQP